MNTLTIADNTAEIDALNRLADAALKIDDFAREFDGDLSLMDGRTWDAFWDACDAVREGRERAFAEQQERLNRSG